jgi:hypothetical protein
LSGASRLSVVRGIRRKKKGSNAARVRSFFVSSFIPLPTLLIERQPHRLRLGEVFNRDIAMLTTEA